MNPEATDPADLPRTLGRYRVLGELGRGGMGLVVRALDPTLGRQVAIKVLVRRSTTLDPFAVLRREARAMARLQHPNVVEVFDVHTDGDQVYIAMELVEGQHLGQWVAARSHPAREVLSRFLLAGHGLAAAHEAGVVHRDFKPSNVLVGGDGRVKVTDFGLARAWGGPPEREATTYKLGPGDDELTFTGAAIGTPSYMAPEQHRGEAADELADQYAFCVALWTALTGASPFGSAQGNEALLAAKESAPSAFPATAGVSRAVIDALTRGLQPCAIDRWPSMHALLQALEAPTRRRAWLPWVAAGALAAVALPTWALATRRPPEPPSCLPDDAAAYWQRSRAEVARTLEQLDPTTAASALTRVDTVSERWTAARAAACETPEFEQRRCVQERGAALVAWAQAHRTPEGLDVDRVLSSVGALDSQPCRTDAKRPPHPDVVLAQAMMQAGRYEGARKSIDALLDRPLPKHAHIEATRVRGELLALQGESEAAIDTLSQAFFDAHAAGMYETAGRAAIKIAFEHGEVHRRFEHAKRWFEQARAMARRAGDPPGLLALLENGWGSFEDARGNYAEAVASYTRSLQMRAQLSDARLPLAPALNNRASAKASLGDYVGAAQDSREAVEVFEEGLGPQHPHTLIAMSNLTANLHLASEYEEVLEVCDELTKRATMRHGSAHDLNATASMQRGLALKRLHREDEAEQAFRAATRVHAELENDGPSAALSWVNLGGILMQQGRYDEAEPWMQRARETLERTLGLQHPTAAQVVGSMGRLRHGQGRYEDAIALFDRTLEALQPTLGDDHPVLGAYLFYRGESRAALGLRDLAEQDFTRGCPMLARETNREDYDACQAALASLP